MPAYRVTSWELVWRDTVVEAADEDAAVQAAYEQDHWTIVDRDIRDVTVEEE